MNNFARSLRERRTRIGLTQKELAAAVGMSDSYISMMERGTSPPPRRHKVLAIADVLNIVELTDRVRFLVDANCVTAEDIAELDRHFMHTSPEIDEVYQGYAAYVSRMAEAALAASSEPSTEDGLIEELRSVLDSIGNIKQREEMISLIQSFVDVLKNPGEHRGDVHDLMRSFFDWLKFRYQIP